ncbi:MAG: hypothetical protein IH987_03140 [Planctomycetes bacterium]|nr:hypothetical protein [Planctomycetota bacterium]
MLADFFAFLDEQVGLDKTILVLSSDHGVDGNPPGQRMGQLNPVTAVETARAALKARYGDDDCLHCDAVIYWAARMAAPSIGTGFRGGVAEQVVGSGPGRMEFRIGSQRMCFIFGEQEEPVVGRRTGESVP